MLDDIGAGFIDRQIAMINRALVQPCCAGLLGDEFTCHRHILKDACYA
jgi:hypothetical protein